MAAFPLAGLKPRWVEGATRASAKTGSQAAYPFEGLKHPGCTGCGGQVSCGSQAAYPLEGLKLLEAIYLIKTIGTAPRPRTH